MAFALGPKAASTGYRLEAFDSIGSTNTEAMAHARAGERGPTWFVTQQQTAGRGRRDRAWVSPRGNLAASIVEVMDVAPPVAATLGFAAGLALEQALQAVSIEARLRAPDSDDTKFEMKWPNDVLAGRRKLSGISLEAEAFGKRELAVVVGIGVNVVAAPEGTPFPATALHALGVHVGAEELFAALSDAWAGLRSVWDNGRGFGALRQLWLERASGLGEQVSVKSGGSTITGVFETIDEAGCLIIATETGARVPIAAGDVYFGSAASARAL
ncbi:biotin--[acetyl-CoA-carboxylase] ligase [Bradyrhizobium prioriisuperbiae]|uniref:biotin--[acetyl-CoA-carboxylase] ligase n=1 Tax=Bradyrhizobium prioriisuperbiae TaxID=2854389 RepID=UPI0028EEA9D9|nr:biotin--[acetyl-CoA-carboxylase] ligase [Bradyrhizobium prioritasuperba]